MAGATPSLLQDLQPPREAENGLRDRNGHAHVPPFSVGGTEPANQKFLKHANKPPPPGERRFPRLAASIADATLQLVFLPAQSSSSLARPEVETQAPRGRSRKCASEALTGRKSSPGHAHLPVASEVYLRPVCSLTASPRRRTDHRGVKAEAEGLVGMAEGGSPEGRAGPRAAGNVSGVGWWGAGRRLQWPSGVQGPVSFVPAGQVCGAVPGVS